MGQRTRQGRAKTRGVPISRAAYRTVAARRQYTGVLRSFEEQTREADNAAGRARFAAKHAGFFRVKYERTGQGTGYSGPKTVTLSPAAVKAANPNTFRAFRKVGVEMRPDGKARPVWRLIAALIGR